MEQKMGISVCLPDVQEAPGGQCCPVCMCKSEEGTDTWPHLSEKEDRSEMNEKTGDTCQGSSPVLFTPTHVQLIQSTEYTEIHNDAIL